MNKKKGEHGWKKCYLHLPPFGLKQKQHHPEFFKVQIFNVRVSVSQLKASELTCSGRLCADNLSHYYWAYSQNLLHVFQTDDCRHFTPNSLFVRTRVVRTCAYFLQVMSEVKDSSLTEMENGWYFMDHSVINKSAIGVVSWSWGLVLTMRDHSTGPNLFET